MNRSSDWFFNQAWFIQTLIPKLLHGVERYIGKAQNLLRFRGVNRKCRNWLDSLCQYKVIINDEHNMTYLISEHHYRTLFQAFRGLVYHIENTLNHEQTDDWCWNVNFVMEQTYADADNRVISILTKTRYCFFFSVLPV